MEGEVWRKKGGVEGGKGVFDDSFERKKTLPSPKNIFRLNSPIWPAGRFFVFR